MRRARWLTLSVVALLITITVWRAYHRPDKRHSRARQTAPAGDLNTPVSVRVEKVVDGDTIVVTGNQSVRLIGVDTPETVKPNTPVQAWGREATEFTKRHVAGKTVRLEFDFEKYDRYNRRLAYVYVGDWFLNEELIRAGLSPAVTKYPYSSEMKLRFRAAEESARRNQVGIWSAK